MIAFHGKKAVQAKYMSRLERHYAADQIIHGVYWEKGKGCAVGCTIHSDDHSAYETELGIPAQIAYLEDRFFESLPNDERKDWPLSFLSAIPVGADLSQVWPQFAAWLMTDAEWGVEHTTNDPEVKRLCREVARRYLARETSGPGAEALAGRLRAAQDAAWAARAAWDAWAASDVWAAWDASAAGYSSEGASAARAARDAWAASDVWAAWDARAARAAGDAAWDAFVEASASQLLLLLSEAPVSLKKTRKNQKTLNGAREKWLSN